MYEHSNGRNRDKLVINFLLVPPLMVVSYKIFSKGSFSYFSSDTLYPTSTYLAWLIIKAKFFDLKPLAKKLHPNTQFATEASMQLLCKTQLSVCCLPIMCSVECWVPLRLLHAELLAAFNVRGMVASKADDGWITMALPTAGGGATSITTARRLAALFCLF